MVTSAIHNENRRERTKAVTRLQICDAIHGRREMAAAL